MFAFCPMVSHDSCGVVSNSESSTDMVLQANKTVNNVSSNKMKYREGKPSYREYDACYYEIVADNLENMNIPNSKTT